MLTRLATAALTLALLAAGAFGVSQAGDTGNSVEAARTTVIAKNSHWPLRGHITAEPCKETICMDT
jgi:hypothetical protein